MGCAKSVRAALRKRLREGKKKIISEWKEYCLSKKQGL